MRPSRLAASAAALLIAATPAIAKDKKPDNLVAVGEPIDCINPRLIRSTHVRDDQTIDFEMNGNTIYRNTLPYKCSGLGFEERFSYKLSTSQLCSVDIITVLQSFGGGLSQGPSCGLGKFQKMEKAKK
ncbi:hypothetical protein [Sphingobium fluviale]|uniref:Uncharacterized protein n=1 Tax=Sphingobium fluviale TaxID=2506423 RepID=A0A4Q1KMJ2_9SPHN|nr:hypothetical protein [Sphingobium fluviale]RXR30932.1 hypothetical protein EQG66_01185 [Sphingobium fluviale]